MKKLLPPPLFLACLIIMTGLHLSFPLVTLLESPWNLFGLAPFLPGITFLTLGSARFIRIKTNLNTFIDPDILVTSGPFRVTRNPMYLGFVLVLIGVWLMFGSLTPILGVAIFGVMANYWYIPFEESKCELVFGEDYLEYKRQVRRWF